MKHDMREKATNGERERTQKVSILKRYFGPGGRKRKKEGEKEKY
jgi:hypothetical protein